MSLRRREFIALAGAGLGSSLVLAACGRLGGSKPRKGPVIGMLQMVDAPPPNLTREGFEEALVAAGYRDGETVTFLQKDAAGELPNTTLVMKQFLGDQVDMVLAVGTPPLQAAMQVMPATTPVVLARQLGRAEEAVSLHTLESLPLEQVDMLTLVMVGSSQSKRFARGDGKTYAYTPRGYAKKRETAE